MTRYQVLVADPLLQDAEYWRPVEGFRLISVDGPDTRHQHATLCTFEDDGAGPELEGAVVEVFLGTDHQTGTVKITGRNRMR